MTVGELMERLSKLRSNTEVRLMVMEQAAQMESPLHAVCEPSELGDEETWRAQLEPSFREVPFTYLVGADFMVSG